MADDTVYPGAIDPDMRAIVQAAPVQPAEASDLLSQLAAAVRAIETELGTTPSGASADVAAALTAILALLIPTPVGQADGKVLKVLSDAAVWGTDATGGGGGGGGYLAKVVKDDALLQPVTATDSPSDIDASLVVTFTVPASGEVFVDLSALASLSIATSGSWTLDDGGGQVAAAQVAYDDNQAHIYMRLYLSGLTPDDSVTLTWRHVRTFGSGAFNTIYGGEAGPAIMAVMDAASA